MLDVARRRAIAELTSQIDTLQLGQGPVLATLVRPLHELIGGDLLWSYCPVQRLDGGWDLEDVYGSALPAAYVERVRRCIAGERGDFAWYRPMRPDRAQRNRVIEAREAVARERPGYFESTALYAEFFHPMRLHRHHQLRALLCDGARLLAWFGIYQQERPHRIQWEILRAFVPSLRRRLAREQALRDTTHSASALVASLEHLPYPACVLDARGRIEVASTSARSLLDRDSGLRARLLEALRGRDGADGAIEIVPLRDRATHVGYLALLRVRAAFSDVRITAAIERWQLTRRQAEVLGMLVRGMANAAIAAELAVTERAVEHHVSALFDRAGVDSRAAFVAAVLGGEWS